MPKDRPAYRYMMRAIALRDQHTAPLFAPLLTLLLSSPTPPPTYTQLKQGIEARRLAFQRSHAAADSAGQVLVLDSARDYLFDRITLDLLPAWHGTAWDFNGMTRVPRQGTIACGYFVNTVLLDAGFRLPRIKWSQEAAEPITLKLAGTVKRFRDRPASEVEAWVLGRGDGLYKVGLDSHVGFIVVRGGVARFVHSNYYRPEVGVMDEPLEGNNPLAHSRYRIVGSLLDDPMMRDWVTGRDLAAPR
jgi:hypothetical protein